MTEPEVTELKYISVKEFREFGFLQEANRCFFHPLGLALSIEINEDGSESLGPIWDSREDPEGFKYDYKGLGKKAVPKALVKMQKVKKLWETKRQVRIKKIGEVIEPITVYAFKGDENANMDTQGGTPLSGGTR